MNFLLLLLAVLAGAVAITRLVQDDPGHMLITYAGYTLETSLAVAAAAAILAFVSLYLVLRLVIHMLHTPERIRQWRRQTGIRRAEQDLIQGVMLMAEGKWGQAEQCLVEHVSRAESPLLHYLSAARAAQLQNAYERRDLYLSKATRSMPRAGTAVALTRAEFQFDHGQWEQALATLSALREQIPRHPRVLKLLALTYQQLGDWPRLLELVDQLKRQHVLEPGHQQRLELAVQRHQLEQVSDAEELHQLWSSLPAKTRADASLIRVFIERLMAVGAHVSAEKLIRRILAKDWDEELCEYYGRLEGGDVAARLKQTEKWLESRPDDPGLLLAAGRIAIQAQLWGVARRLLEASLSSDPTPEAYLALGALHEQLGESSEALDCYRNGLRMNPDTHPMASLQLENVPAKKPSLTAVESQS